MKYCVKHVKVEVSYAFKTMPSLVFSQGMALPTRGSGGGGGGGGGEDSKFCLLTASKGLVLALYVPMCLPAYQY